MNQREVNQEGAVNLTNCDREPIHIPGSIQSHGCMIACDARAATVLRHSANTAAILGLSGEINGLSLEAVVGADAVHTLRNALATIGEGMRPALLLGLHLPAGTFDVSIHIFRSIVIIEFEAAVSGQPLQLARSLIGRISDIDDTDKLVRQHTEFPDLESYLRGYAIIGDVLKPLKVPSRLITAADDPIVLEADLERLPDLPALKVTRTQFGGHCGFIGMPGPGWVAREVLAELRADA